MFLLGVKKLSNQEFLLLVLGKLNKLEHYLQNSLIFAWQRPLVFHQNPFSPSCIPIEFKLESLCPVRDHIFQTSMQLVQELFSPMKCEWK